MRYRGKPSKGGRKAVKRRALWRSQDKRCHWCAESITYPQATLDRLMPGSEGGQYTWDNLVVACEPCNTIRQSLPVEEWLEVIRLYWKLKEERQSRFCHAAE